MRSRAAATALRVVVLAGGDSAEREISLASGRNVARALAKARHNVAVIDPAKEPLDSIDWRRFDVCFVALHGGAGEDGRVQAMLESIGIPYTGSGPAASGLAMSKTASKECFLSAGVPTPAFATFDSRDPIAEVTAKVAALGYPIIIKPDSQGSSLGISCARTPADLARSLEECLRFDSMGLAEKKVEGREFTVAVLDRRPLPLLEIVGLEGIFSFDCKYQDQSIEHRFDFDLSLRDVRRLESAAVAAVEAIGTSGLARVDLMLDRVNEPWVLEVNTSPGMTERSLAPDAAARAGLEMPALCDQLIRECLSLEYSS